MYNLFTSPSGRKPSALLGTHTRWPSTRTQWGTRQNAFQSRHHTTPHWRPRTTLLASSPGVRGLRFKRGSTKTSAWWRPPTNNSMLTRATALTRRSASRSVRHLSQDYRTSWPHSYHVTSILLRVSWGGFTSQVRSSW